MDLELEQIELRKNPHITIDINSDESIQCASELNLLLYQHTKNPINAIILNVNILIRYC